MKAQSTFWPCTPGNIFRAGRLMPTVSRKRHFWSGTTGKKWGLCSKIFWAGNGFSDAMFRKRKVFDKMETSLIIILLRLFFLCRQIRFDQQEGNKTADDQNKGIDSLITGIQGISTDVEEKKQRKPRFPCLSEKSDASSFFRLHSVLLNTI